MLRLLVWTRARALLRHEAAEDLLQDVNLHALQVAGRFEYRSDGQFAGWLRKVAQQCLVNRHRSWSALRRNLGDLYGRSELTSVDQRHAHPSETEAGPATLAERRDLLTLMARLITTLPARDQRIVLWEATGVPLADIAARLGLSRESANRARLRALERLRVVLEPRSSVNREHW
ncbi:MAG TPA: sigma-70 family RNA polymerase sigma factor [Planctomycetota bacterium]|nr:sigma-70 family RNA polymerase sigma factor [Planctomycetota bacterium]